MYTSCMVAFAHLYTMLVCFSVLVEFEHENQTSYFYCFVVQKCSFTVYHFCMVQCVVYPEISTALPYSSFGQYKGFCVCVILEWFACGSVVWGLNTCTQRPLPR